MRSTVENKVLLTDSVEIETPSNNHALPDCVFNRRKQTVARSREENDLPNRNDQQKARNAHISNSTSQIYQ